MALEHQPQEARLWVLWEDVECEASIHRSDTFGARPEWLRLKKPIQANGTIEPQTSEKSRPVARPAKPGADMRLCVDDWVEVRSKAEILSTLDENGRLEGLPFMPQMFQYCGQRIQVYKRAHKTCDTVSGARLRRPPPPRRGSSRTPLRRSSLWWLSGGLPDLLEGGMA